MSSVAADGTDLELSAAVVSARETLENGCDIPGSVPLELAGGRHFVLMHLRGPKGSEVVRLQIGTGADIRGIRLSQTVARRIGVLSPSDLPRELAIGGDVIQLPPNVPWDIVDEESTDVGTASAMAQATRKRFAGAQLGAGFLSRFLVCIDPSAERLALLDERTLLRDDVDRSTTVVIRLGLELLGEPPASFPFVAAFINYRGRRVGASGALLDTSAPTSMMDVDELDSLGVKHAVPVARGLAGDADVFAGTSPERMLAVSNVVLGRTVPCVPGEDCRYDTVDGGPSIIVGRLPGTWPFQRLDFFAARAKMSIGNDILNRFRILIDYRGRRVFLSHTYRPTDRSSIMNRVGISLSFDDAGCPVVRHVTETNAKRTRDALQPGDTLLGVDGADACAMWHHELASALAGRPGEERELRILRRGQFHVVTGVVTTLLP